MMLKAETSTLAGQAVSIRPIRHTDVAMEAAFINRLSLQTKHYRFFGGVKELSAIAIGRLCDTDGPHRMAFVATVQEADFEVQIGVCRYVPDSNAVAREMAVTVADAWLHTGLGELLLKRLIATAKHYGIRQLYSLELHDNQMMRELASELGMTAVIDPLDAQQVVYSLNI